MLDWRPSCVLDWSYLYLNWVNFFRLEALLCLDWSYFLLDIHTWDLGLDLPNSDWTSQQFW